MAIFIPIAATSVPSHWVPIPASLAILILMTGVVVAVLYAYQPPIPQSMVCSFLPWLVAGSLLPVLAAVGQYPTYLSPLFATPGAYLTAMFVPGVTWLVMLNLAVSRRTIPAFHHYIAAMGVGVLIVLWSALVGQLGVSSLSRMLVLVLVPLVTFLATIAVTLTIGFWSPDFIEYTLVTGGFVVFGGFVHGIATVVAVAANGPAAHTTFSAAVWGLVAIGARHWWLGVDPAYLWAWTLIAANVGLAIVIATRLAPLATARPRTVHAALGVVGGVAFTVGFNDLVRVVVG